MNLLQGWQRRSGKKTGDPAPSEFLRQLAYKTDWRSGALDTLPRSFPSGKLCHNCGRHYAGLSIGERRRTCLQCGVVHDRDANAALNLRDHGPELPGDCSWMPCKTTDAVAAAVEPGTGDSAKLKPRWNLHLWGDEDWLRRHSKALPAVPGRAVQRSRLTSSICVFHLGFSLDSITFQQASDSGGPSDGIAGLERVNNCSQ